MADEIKRIVVFGNSGAGKSTLSKQLSAQLGVIHLDLDILAWNDTKPPTRAPISQSSEIIQTFMRNNRSWVIEGGYADLLSVAIAYANEVIFLNKDTNTCIENAKNRPWEPHKYASIAQQNENLAMLLDWIKDYETRDDVFSLSAHQRLFSDFKGTKKEYESNDE